MAKEAGYSGTPLVTKLGIKAGFLIYTQNAPDHYWDLLSPLPVEIRLAGPDDQDLDFIHYFETQFAPLEDNVRALKSRIKPNGMIWISWPKGGSKIPTDLNGNIIRNCVLKTELVDIKVCAVDHDWSGLKFMIRKELR